MEIMGARHLVRHLFGTLQEMIDNDARQRYATITGIASSDENQHPYAPQPVDQLAGDLRPAASHLENPALEREGWAWCGLSKPG